MASYDAYQPTSSSLGRQGRAVTPGAIDLSPIPKAVVCLTGGNITIVPVGNADADTLTFAGVPAGFVVPYIVRRVTAATATVATIED